MSASIDVKGSVSGGWDDVSQSPGDFLESLPHSLEESILLSLSKTILCCYRHKAFQTLYSFVKYLLETSYV